MVLYRFLSESVSDSPPRRSRCARKHSAYFLRKKPELANVVGFIPKIYPEQSVRKRGSTFQVFNLFIGLGIAGFKGLMLVSDKFMSHSS